MSKERTNTSVRLTPEAAQLLRGLAKKLGVSQTAVIEMAIRRFAQQEGVEGGTTSNDLRSV